MHYGRTKDEQGGKNMQEGKQRERKNEERFRERQRGNEIYPLESNNGKYTDERGGGNLQGNLFDMQMSMTIIGIVHIMVSGFIYKPLFSLQYKSEGTENIVSE